MKPARSSLHDQDWYWIKLPGREKWDMFCYESGRGWFWQGFTHYTYHEVEGIVRVPSAEECITYATSRFIIRSVQNND